MSRRMLFIKPPSYEMGSVAKTRNFHFGTVPYGILSIISYVDKYVKNDVKLDLLDLNVAPWTSFSKEEFNKNLGDSIAEFCPDIVGVSVMYNHIFPYIEKIGKVVKDVNPETVVVSGGSCVIAYYEKILEECLSIDAICYSEGEIPVLKLLEADSLHELLESHPSFLTKSGLSNKKVPHPTYVENLDDIPLVDFGLLDLSKYVTRQTIFRPEEIAEEVCLPITTTRGCPYNCVFCIAGDLHGKKIRKTSASRIVADAKEMMEKYAMNVLSIEDDQSLADGARAKEMLKGLAELDLELWMIGGFTVSLLDQETAMLLSRAGLKIATLPIESGSPYVLHEIIDKPIKLEMVPGVVKNLKAEGILCHANIVVGFPGEKEEHRQESLDFIKNSDIDWCYIFCANALKGSRLYEECAAEGFLSEKDYNVDGYCASNINTPDFTAEEITRKAYLMNLELNFVNNNNVKNGDYQKAALYFKHVASKYDDHALSNYFLAKCYENLSGYHDKMKLHYDRFYKIIDRSKEQRGYAEHFKII